MTTNQELINQTPAPRTRLSLAEDLRQLGVQAGMTLIVHSSLRSLGYVCGSSVAVVQALMDVVTTAGTLVMPTQTSDYSDPAKWTRPPVPSEWWETMREMMPAYDPEVTPSSDMGLIVETFRTWPGTLRSKHPQVSFAAWGRHAFQIVSHHSLEYSLGEDSPLGRIYDLDGQVLLLGVSYESCTSFHLAEYRAPGAIPELMGAPVLERGERVWKPYADIEINSEIFPEIGADFEAQGLVTTGRVGSANSRLFSQCAGVDFAQQWLTGHRSGESSSAM